MRSAERILLLCFVAGPACAGGGADATDAQGSPPSAPWLLYAIAEHVRAEHSFSAVERLDLGREEATRYLLSGFDDRVVRPGPLEDAIWAVHDEAEARFDLLEPADLVLALRAAAFPVPGRVQRVSLVWNGADVGRSTIDPEGTVVAAKVPRTVVRPGRNVLRLRFDRTEVPASAPVADFEFGSLDADAWIEGGWARPDPAAPAAAVAPIWAVGPESVLRVPSAARRGARLTIVAGGVPTAAGGDRRLRASWNGVSLGEVALSSAAGLHAWTIPDEAVVAGSNRLAFQTVPRYDPSVDARFPGAAYFFRARVDAEPLWRDVRRLAARIDWIEVRPDEATRRRRARDAGPGRLDAERRSLLEPATLSDFPATVRDGDSLLVRANAGATLPLEAPAGTRVEAVAEGVSPISETVEAILSWTNAAGATTTLGRTTLEPGGRKALAYEIPAAAVRVPGGVDEDDPDSRGEGRLPVVRGSLTLAVRGPTRSESAVRFSEARVLAPGAPPPRPPVVLVVVDTLRADHLSAYGYERETSPSLERFAAEGVRFDRAYATAPWTLPSMVALLSGEYPDAARVLPEARPARSSPSLAEEYRLVESRDTLAERLARKGYATAAWVDSLFLAPYSGLDQGFASFDDSPARSTEADPTEGAERIFASALAWIDRRPPGPFFLLLHVFDVHAPYLPPAPYDTLFRDGRGRRGPSLPLGGSNFVFGAIAAIAVQADIERLSHYVDAYDREIRRTDDLLGAFLDGLRSRGVYEDSVVVVTADHGEAFGEGELYCNHGTMVEPVLRIPLVWKGPRGSPRGMRVDSIVQTIDLTASLVEAATGVTSEDLPGRSFLPILRGETSAIRETAFANGGILWQSAAISDRWKLVRLAPGLAAPGHPSDPDAFGTHPFSDSSNPDRVVTHLYDLARDPLERRDVAAERGSEARRLLRLLVAWQEEMDRRAAAFGGAREGASAPSDEVLEGLRDLGYLR